VDNVGLASSLTDWKPASETELYELAGPGKPPPLPGESSDVGPPPILKDPVCKACGAISDTGARFCSACGRPLPS